MRDTTPGPRGPLLTLPVVRGVAVLVILVVGAGMAALLLSPDGWGINRLNVRIWITLLGPLGLHRHVSPEQFAVAANVVLFVPVFWALAVLRPRWWWIAVGMGASIGVELYQQGLETRLSEVDDVLANTAGAALGVWLGILTVRRLRDARGVDRSDDRVDGDPHE